MIIALSLVPYYIDILKTLLCGGQGFFMGHAGLSPWMAL